MSEFYNSNDFYERPSKIFKYECELIQFDLGYLTKDGEILILENKYVDIEYNDKMYKPILHFQTINYAKIYIICNLSVKFACYIVTIIVVVGNQVFLITVSTRIIYILNIHIKHGL